MPPMTPRQWLVTVTVLAGVAGAVTALVTMDPTGARTPRTGADYVAQAVAAARDDRALVRWREVATWPLALAAPRALAVTDAGTVLVVGDGLEQLAADGSRLLRVPLPTPARAVTAAGSRVFVATATGLDEWALAGTEAKHVAGLDLAARQVDLWSLARTPQGLFAADARGCRVWRLPLAEGAGLADAGEPEVFAARLTVPSTLDIAADADGGLVTVDPGMHVVQRRDDRGDVVRTLGGEGESAAEFGGCCNPIAVAVTADGRTVTAEKGLASTRVKVFDAQGRLHSVVAGPDCFDVLPDGPPTVLDVGVDAQGRVLVLDPHRRQVRVFALQEKDR